MAANPLVLWFNAPIISAPPAFSNTIALTQLQRRNVKAAIIPFGSLSPPPPQPTAAVKQSLWTGTQPASPRPTRRGLHHPARCTSRKVQRAAAPLPGLGRRAGRCLVDMEQFGSRFRWMRLKGMTGRRVCLRLASRGTPIRHRLLGLRRSCLVLKDSRPSVFTRGSGTRPAERRVQIRMRGGT
ncbi:uncharacterized protein EV422DRAFT_106423 [Fimicolochytrium jonesii]|uniref:uncharacterized protein n=1 Tax=Fimicolochytrium jonesii TaxID=1396493 RepID=UPI0022FEF1A7|nr:uncharacterized protein EV422DRAFT_106423 [Fimicolochytrium jonesii]KAI8819766.1 hypothetical protein EV422DRAFT_106423 [Fimicolochytrium jonesii]